MKQSQNITTTNTITYRNAIYQGGINTNKQTRKDFGIIYLAKTHQFIVCNNWHNDFLEGECLFYNDDQKFIYGTWINNIPQGFNVFRVNDVLLMTEFRRGKLVKNTPILIVFEKYNIAGIMIVTNDPQGLDDLQLQIYDKKEVFTSEDVRQLFNQCQWPQDYFTNNQTLVKYISYKLTKNLSENQNKQNKNPCKLRLVESKYYRFGYDDGLAIIFDEDFNRISVGSHFKSKLKSFGISFDRPEPVIKPQKGKIIKMNPINTVLKAAIKNEFEKTQRKLSTQKNISKTNLLTGVNFCNKFYKNPSKLFEYFVQNIIKETSIRNLIAGSLTTRKLFEESLQFSRIESTKGNNISNDEIFYSQKQPQVEEQINQGPNKMSSSRLSKKKIIEDRLRLEAIKKEIYESLESKKSKIQKQIRNQQYQRDIIHKEIVGKSHYHTPQRTLDKSRSRKRIFEESQKNLKLLRDFTPTKSEPNLTPFKTKMKNRIFNGETSKFSQQNNYQDLSKSKSRNKSKQKTYADDEEMEIRPGVLKNYSKFSSGDSLDERSSQLFQRSKDTRNLRNQDERKEHQFSLNDYHVSFEDNRDLNKRSNASSNKYPSESGRNHNYVPINPSQVKDRKRSSKNLISIQDQSLNHIQVGSYRKVYENERNNNNTERQNQIIQPETKYFLQKSQNENVDHGSYRKSKGESLQVTLKQQNSKNKRQIFYEEIQPQNNQNDRYQKYEEMQNYPTHHQKQTIKKLIYNEDTFKQNTFDEQNENDQSRRSAFKHSNQVYLDQYQDIRLSKNRLDDTQGKRSVRKAFQYSQNRSTSSLIKNESQKVKQLGGISYGQKHKIKKSMQKDIQKSPDHHRCYGKTDNSPYLQNSPQYEKSLYHSSNKQPDMSNKRRQLEYDDSSYKLMKKDISNSIRNYPKRLF